MAYVVVMPRLGQTMEVGQIDEWMKNEGESIEQGELLLKVQTDKAVLEVEADCGGILLKQLAQPADGEIDCFEPIAVIAAPGEEVDVDALIAQFRARRG